MVENFARSLGYISLASGVVLLAFPEAARRLMRTRAEFAQLSPAALRLLGAWELLTGALLVSVTARPAAEVRTREVVSPERRKAA